MPKHKTHKLGVHRWSTTYSKGELERQECACGATRVIAYDHQGGSVQIEYHPAREDDENA